MSKIAKKISNASHSFMSIFENFLSNETTEVNSITEFDNIINNEDDIKAIKTAKTLRESLIAIEKIEYSFEAENNKTLASEKKKKSPSLKSKIIQSEIIEKKMIDDNERSR